MTKKIFVIFLCMLFSILVINILISPTYAMLEVTDSYQFNCEYNKLINAVNRSISEMKLTVLQCFTEQDNAYITLHENSKITSTHWPVFYKIEVYKDKNNLILKITAGSNDFSVSQKSYHKKRVKEFMDNVKSFIEQEISINSQRLCPACKESIENNAIICKHCRSYIGSVNIPLDIKVLSEQQGQVEIFWKDASNNEDGFYIERKTADGDYVKIATVERNIEHYCDKTAVSGNEYLYRIKAFNIEHESGYSSEVSITVQ